MEAVKYLTQNFQMYDKIHCFPYAFVLVDIRCTSR